jgi:NTP pyrophosphatase (non-canonical NTP hydrolase)
MSNLPEKQQPRLSLIPPRFLLALADLLQRGDEKHEPMGWMKQSIRQRLDSLGRHYLALCAGDDHDPEFGHQHALHLAANAMMVWWQIEQGYAGSGLDQRRFRSPARLEDPRLAANIAATLDAVVPNRSLLGTLAKTEEELAELRAEIHKAIHRSHDGEQPGPELADELADVFICVSDLARACGVDLVSAAEAKLAVLRTRDQVARAADKAATRDAPLHAEERFDKHGPAPF